MAPASASFASASPRVERVESPLSASRARSPSVLPSVPSSGETASIASSFFFRLPPECFSSPPPPPRGISGAASTTTAGARAGASEPAESRNRARGSKEGSSGQSRVIPAGGSRVRGGRRLAGSRAPLGMMACAPQSAKGGFRAADRAVPSTGRTKVDQGSTAADRRRPGKRPRGASACARAERVRRGARRARASTRWMASIPVRAAPAHPSTETPYARCLNSSSHLSRNEI